MAKQIDDRLATAILWIAQNDGPGDNLPVAELQDQIPVLLVADVFGVPALHVAKTIWAIRNTTPEARFVVRG